MGRNRFSIFIGKKRKTMKNNMICEDYSFATEMRTLMEAYKSKVCVSKNKVVVKREGKTSLPAETTIYFKDATAVSWGTAVGRSWISFTVPGATSLGRNAVITSNKVAVGFSGPHIPYDDSFSIVFGMRQENEARKHFNAIKKIFDEYKDRSIDSPVSVTTIQQDSAMDKLKKLKELKEMGILSDAEYEEKRQKLLTEI